jgi:hypothetical protein
MGLKIDSESGFGELLNSEREIVLYIAFHPSNNVGVTGLLTVI